MEPCRRAGSLTDQGEGGLGKLEANYVARPAASSSTFREGLKKSPRKISDWPEASTGVE
jgi:hypothetical protein